MAHHQHHQDNHTNPAGSILISRNATSLEPLNSLDDEAILDVDEPPDDNHLLFKRQPIRSPTFVSTNDMQAAIERNRQKSLLTQGLTGESKSSTPRPKSIISSYSNDSIASTAELTSDGGLTSPARTSTPSPPLPVTTLNLQDPLVPLKKVPTVILAPTEPPRKRCITFACGKPPAKTEITAEQKKADVPEVKKTCAIKFACPARPKEPAAIEPPTISSQAVLEKVTEDQTTPKKLMPKASFSRSPSASKKKRPSEALRFHEFASRHLEEDEWVHEKPRRQSKLTVSDTLRKENEYRKLGEEVAEEAREAEREEDEDAMNAEDDDDDNDFDDDDDLDDDDDDEEDEPEDDDVDSDGNESDNEAGFADSDDDEIEENSDYQFWTNGLTTAATSTDHLEHIRLRQRSPSASSIDSAVGDKGKTEYPRSPKVKKSNRKAKRQPSTPELPDSTDFVCGTLDEDRPLEAAYLACIAQRKLAKRGILPQDLDPTFPTSDAEQDQSEDEGQQEDSPGSNDGTWAAGHFDDFDMKDQGTRGRRDTKVRSPSISPKRVKSPCPQGMRNRIMAHTPPPTRRLFGQSPRRNKSPAPRYQPASPPASRHPSFEDKNMNIPRLAQTSHLTDTKSLPRTPNPFWKEHRRHRKDRSAPMDDSTEEIHTRGPIDIVQGLENKRRRRKEKFWLTHCRKEAKEKEKDRRRQPPGRGAKRMRELGLEAADRCKGYGQRLQLVLSI